MHFNFYNDFFKFNISIFYERKYQRYFRKVPKVLNFLMSGIKDAKQFTK